MKLNQGILYLVVMTVLAGCSGKHSGKLEVMITVVNIDKVATEYPRLLNNGEMKVMLFSIPPDRNVPPIQLDSAMVSAKKNTITLKGQTSGTGMYDVAIEHGPLVPLINDASSISVNIDLTTPAKYYTAKGSEASSQLQDFVYGYADKSIGIDEADNEIDSLKKISADTDIIKSVENKRRTIIENLNSYIVNYLNNVKQPTVAAFVLGRAAGSLSQQEFETELNTVGEKFPGDGSIAEIKKQYKAQMEHIAKLQNDEAVPDLTGKPAPALSLPDVNGKEVSLASYKGKYLLVDFWASWCGPCRMENPNVLAAWNRYKNKNFAILGVSLDDNKSSWLQAIEQDHLSWTHVSDLSRWDSKAVSTYGFKGIPFNVLIDPNGIIVAEALRGDELENKLAEVLH